MEKPQHILRIRPFKTSLVLSAISMVILIFSLLGQRAYNTGNPTEKFFRELFTTEFFVNNGENIATYWNMLMLVFVSALTFVIASVKQVQKDKFRYGWWGLGAIFTFFTVDTLAGISFRLARLLKQLPDLEDGSLYTWLPPLTIVVILLVLLFFIWFYLHLDVHNKFLFPISMILYTLGAYKAELFSGQYAEIYGIASSSYLLLTHAEEFAEYLGIILMIYLLLTYLASHVSEIEFTA